jgi:hypothetical protein
MLSAKHLRVKVAGKKLAPKFIGPFQVRASRRSGLPTSLTQLVPYSQRVPRFQARGLQQPRRRGTLGPPRANRWHGEMGGGPSDGQGVDPVADKERVNGQVFSRAAWKGCDESTWEPAENLQNAQEAIRDYESRTRQVDMTTEQDQLLEEPSGPSGQQESVAKHRGGSAQPRRGKKSRPPRNK